MEDGGYKYRFSLINEFMFEADQHFFAQENQMPVGYYNPRILYAQDQIWIAPDLNLLEPEERSVPAERLTGYVEKNSKLYLTNNLGKELGSRDNVFKLWRGFDMKKNEIYCKCKPCEF